MNIRTMLLTGFAVAGLGLSGIAVAHDDEAHVEKRQIKRIIIENKDGTTREIEPDKIEAMAAKCASEGRRFETADESVDGDERKKSKIVICTGDDKEMLSALENARSRLAKEDALAEAHRGKALAAIDAEIARLRQNGATE